MLELETSELDELELSKTGLNGSRTSEDDCGISVELNSVEKNDDELKTAELEELLAPPRSTILTVLLFSSLISAQPHVPKATASRTANNLFFIDFLNYLKLPIAYI